MSKLTKKERLLHSLIGIKQLFNNLGVEDLKNEIVLKDGTTETIDCYKEIETFVVDFINNEVDKATPKKPVRVCCEPEEEWDNEEEFYNCPNCGEPLPYNFDYDYPIKNKCCLECQQVLDWSDENDR